MLTIEYHKQLNWTKLKLQTLKSETKSTVGSSPSVSDSGAHARPSPDGTVWPQFTFQPDMKLSRNLLKHCFS